MSNNILSNEEEKLLVVTYGFEYDKIIVFPSWGHICRSVTNKNNIIYSSILIRDYNIKNIITKIKIAESKHDYYLSYIDDLAKFKNIQPKWQLVYYDSNFNNYINSKIQKSLSQLKTKI